MMMQHSNPVFGVSLFYTTPNYVPEQHASSKPPAVALMVAIGGYVRVRLLPIRASRSITKRGVVGV